MNTANTQRWLNVDICWNNVVTSVNLITTLTQRRFGNGDLSITVIYRCWNKVGFGLTLRTILLWCHDAGKIKIFILNVEKIAVFERRNNVSLSTLKFNVEATWILGCHSKHFVLMPWCSRNYNLYINVEKVCIFNVETVSFYQR